jgi:membrane protein
LEKIFIYLSDKYTWITPFVFKLKHLTLPGFDGVPVYEVWKFFIKEMQDHSIIVNAKAIAYSYFLAIFPAMIFLFTLIPYIPIPNLAQDIIKFIFNTVPNDGVFNLIAPTINDITTKPRGGLLSFGILSALYFTSNGVMSMIQSFDASLGNKSRRKPWKNQLIALVITIELLLLFIVSIVVLVIGSKVLDNMLILTGLKNTFTGFILHFLRYLITILFFFFSLAVIYYYGPTSKAIRFKFISTGATVATILCIVIAVLFTNFVSNFNNYNTVYGSLGTIVFTMIWFYWNAFALLIGFEINKSIYYTKSKRLNAPE